MTRLYLSIILNEYDLNNISSVQAPTCSHRKDNYSIDQDISRYSLSDRMFEMELLQDDLRSNLNVEAGPDVKKCLAA